MAMPAAYFDHDLNHKNNKQNINIIEINQLLDTINQMVPTVEQLKCISHLKNNHHLAINLARSFTKRNKIIVITNSQLFNQKSADNDDNVEFIVADDSSQLCLTIASSAERIAAIVVKYHQASPYYFKKVRELASAEGAVMIWDNLDNATIDIKTTLKISKKSLPDLICFYNQSTVNNMWLGGKAEILSLL